ncbi:unnamed protein product, partial [Ilex paraguariensis]
NQPATELFDTAMTCVNRHHSHKKSIYIQTLWTVGAPLHISLELGTVALSHKDADLPRLTTAANSLWVTIELKISKLGIIEASRPQKSPYFGMASGDCSQ